MKDVREVGKTAAVRCAWPCVATVVLSCGDNSLPIGLELVHGRDLTIVAHPEDDLVFMQPDLLERSRGGGTANVYISDGANGSHHLGLMAAYSKSTGHEGWRCGWIELRGHAAEHCRLPDAHLSLVFLGLPEGDPAGDTPMSLPKLWSGELDVAITAGDRQAIYTRANLLDVITEIVDLVDPHTVRTSDVTHKHGPDHMDHVVAGAAALLAVAAARGNPEVIAYRGESTLVEAPNVIEPLFQRSAEILGHYDACAGSCGTCGTEDVCAVNDERADWLRRRYAIALRRTASGALRTDGGECITATAEGLLEVGGCVDNWELARDGSLRAGERCIALQDDGELRAAINCSRFFFDDEGHVWIGGPPPATPGGPLLCMVLVDGRPRARRCGIELAPGWEMSPMPTAMPRPQGLAGTGRAVRLGDLDADRHADLCEVANGRLQCARGDGTGNFGPVRTIRAFAVEPESLVIGDVDGDGLSDACGRDAGGILCATAATSFQPQRWTTAFARVGPANAADRSLAAVDANDDGAADICGLTPTGVACATHNPLAAGELRSAWPAAATALWPADLDGDRRADWCAATVTGAACGLDLHRELTTDGVPWSFSQNGVVDETPPDTATGAVADVDGDGRADLCSIRGRRIACARSQGYGFGPTATLATLPADAAPTALWLGDLDGDGTADACVDDAGTIRCVRSRAVRADP